MKRLLGLLLVMGMVGCGGNENAGNAVDPGIGADEQLVTDSGEKEKGPSNPNAEVTTSTPAETDDPVAALEKLGARIQRNEQDLIVGVNKQVTRAALVHLQGLSQLKNFELRDSQGTDTGLVHLKGLTKLDSLHVPELVTAAGRLRTAEAVSGFVGHHVKTRGKIGDASC